MEARKGVSPGDTAGFQVLSPGTGHRRNGEDALHPAFHRQVPSGGGKSQAAAGSCVALGAGDLF